MLTVVIPAHNEAAYLNRTIRNALSTATGPIEVVVVDQGGNGPIDLLDGKVVVVEPAQGNVGERVAMNMAADKASGSHLFRIDAHCDFSPDGWDRMLCEVTDDRTLTMAVLTALRMPWDQADQTERDKWLASGKSRTEWSDWSRLPGHWYGFTRFVCTGEGDSLEAKWQKPNREHAHYHGVHPTMAATGCGMCLTAKLYDDIGGADSTLAPMGAIGEEFAIKVWHAGGHCQVHTDVIVGHIFGTGGYDTGRVHDARRALWRDYHETYDRVIALPQFADFNTMRVVRADQPGKPARTVTVTRVDTTDTHDDAGKLLRRKIETFKYVWIDNEHPDEHDWDDSRIEQQYAPLAVKVKEEVLYADDSGKLIEPQVVEAKPLILT